jgi:hypothetical protein
VTRGRLPAAAGPVGLCDTKEGPLAIAAGLSFDAADSQRSGLVAGERFAHVRSGDQDGCRHNNGFRSRKDAKAFLVLTEGVF